MKIKVLKINKELPLPRFIKKGDWIDLYVSKTTALGYPYANRLRKVKFNDIEYKGRDLVFDFQLIPLGVAIKLPKGFEAIVAPRSSTFKKYSILQANSIGIIDNSYSGNDDEWQFPALAFNSVTLREGTRICQFRIQLSQKATFWQKLKWLFSNKIELVEVNALDTKSRGGFGSTN